MYVLVLVNQVSDISKIQEQLTDLGHEAVFQIIGETDYLPIRQLLLSTIWNSKLDYSYFLPEFVEISIDGDFMEALECLTIIENLDLGDSEQKYLHRDMFIFASYAGGLRVSDVLKLKWQNINKTHTRYNNVWFPIICNIRNNAISK